MKFIKIKEAGISKTPQKILVYGDPDTGKTLAAGKLTKHFKKVIWVDLEKGYTTLSQLPTEDTAHIEMIRVKDTSLRPAGITTVMKMFEKAVKICEEHGRIFALCPECTRAKADFIDIDLHNEDTDTLFVLDSMTKLSASGLNHVVSLDKVDLASLKAEDKATFNHWGLQGRYLGKILSDLEQLPCHVVVTSHEQIIKNADLKEKLSPVGGTANFSKQLAKSFDHVVRLYVMNKKHVGISNTTDNAKAVAGSRTGVDVMNPEGEVDLYRLFSLPDPNEVKVKPKGGLSLKK